MKLDNLNNDTINRFYDVDIVSNVIISRCLNKDISINNLRLNQFLCIIEGEWHTLCSGVLLSERPVLNSKFATLPSVYNRFKYLGSNPIRSIPSDFNFLSLLEETDTPTEVHSQELLSQMKKVDNEVGNWIVYILNDYLEVPIFELIDIVKEEFLLQNCKHV